MTQDKTDDERTPCFLYSGAPRGIRGSVRQIIATQLDDCRQYAQEHDYHILGEQSEAYPDDGPQPGLAMACSALPRADWTPAVLVVYSYERFGRTPYHSESYRYWLQQHRCTVECATGPNKIHEPLAVLAARIVEARLEVERGLRGAQVSARWKYWQSTGRRVSFHPRYGWKKDPDDFTRIVPNPKEQEVLSLIMIFAEYGWSPQRIADELTLRGARARGGKPFHPHVLRRIIKREREDPLDANSLQREETELADEADEKESKEP